MLTKHQLMSASAYILDARRQRAVDALFADDAKLLDLAINELVSTYEARFIACLRGTGSATFLMRDVRDALVAYATKDCVVYIGEASALAEATAADHMRAGS